MDDLKTGGFYLPGAHEPPKVARRSVYCVEHHFSQVDQLMSKFGMHFYGMAVLYAHAKLTVGQIRTFF